MVFIRSLPFKIEIKDWEYAEKKWHCFFNYPDHLMPGKVLSEIDLDKL